MPLTALLALVVLIATPAASPIPIRAPEIPAFCAVTPPNGVDPPHVEPPGAWVGNDGLYVGVPTNGIYYAKTEPDRDGGWNKHIWVRDAGQGPLTITVEPVGEHLAMTPGRADADPGSFVMEIWFPDEGCYEITGTTAQTTITVTVWVGFVESWTDVPPP
jgi:hypothetical protein